MNVVRKSELAYMADDLLVRWINQTQARVLLALLLAGKPLKASHLASLVGASTSQISQAGRKLAECGAIQRSDGAYKVGPLLYRARAQIRNYRF